MKIGQPVEGLMTQHWRFVDEDLYGITDRVIQYDADARLGIHYDGHLGILRFVKADFAPEGAWIVAFNLDDPDSPDGRWYGEPDARVIDQMGRGDLHKRDPKDSVRKLKRMWQLEELRQELEGRAMAREMAEKMIFEYRKKKGQKRKAYT